jgi:ribokinase
MIIVFGSINLDLIFPVDALPVGGETVLGRTLRIEPGGKGANQAVAAARDGAQVVFAGAVGRDALAADSLRLLEANGVDISRVVRADTSTGCAAICVDPQGRNLIAVASGANLAARQLQIEQGLLGRHATVLLQMENDPAETAALIARARAAGARVVLNLAPAAMLPREALQALDLLVVNSGEGAWLGTSLGTGTNAASLRAALGVDVVETLGDAGLQAVTAETSIRLAARQVQVVDTTAAGDCFIGVLAAGLDRGLALEPALGRANCAAALCCTRMGSQGSLPTAAETDAALNA